MSSFVINKREYVKAAGLMYGIEASKNLPHKYFLDHVRENFVKCYELNVDSVNEQYGNESGKDFSDYDYEFEQYCKIGEHIWWYGLYNGMTFKELRINLMEFFRSVLYQIENEEMSQFVAAFFFECTSKMFGSELYAVEGWWGDIGL